MKHLQSIHFGQTVQRYKLSDVLIEAINDKMDKDIENGSPVVAKYNYTSENSSLKRNVYLEEIGNSALYLVSDLSSAITGEIHYVDCGFNIVGMPKT